MGNTCFLPGIIILPTGSNPPITNGAIPPVYPELMNVLINVLTSASDVANAWKEVSVTSNSTLMFGNFLALAALDFWANSESLMMLTFGMDPKKVRTSFGAMTFSALRKSDTVFSESLSVPMRQARNSKRAKPTLRIASTRPIRSDKSCLGFGNFRIWLP